MMNSVTVNEQEVKTFLQTLLCTQCGADMVRNSTIKMSYPPRWMYDCPQCYYHHEDIDIYPRHVTKLVEVII